METEKVCVNLPAAELGKIDVLVAQGLFASRTDLIRAGIRSVLESHADDVRRVAHRAQIGYQLVLASDLEDAVATGQRLSLFAVGVLRIQGSVTPELADAAIAQIRIFGALRGPEPVLTRLADRTIRGGDNFDL